MAKATIHNEIRRLRFEHGEMTQQALADAVGCSRQTIIVLEQGRYAHPLLLLQDRRVRGLGREVFQYD
jgi:putative transcriptional regulator